MIWPQWNSVVELPDGNIMTCSPRTSNLTIIDKHTGNIKWRWGKDIISFAHNPTMLDNGNILVFDNGRFSSVPPHSRVIEVNPNSGQIEWKYEAATLSDFFSPFISGCERLPNGNTLICEGAKGRLFEVTSNGEIVWEYIVPSYTNTEEYGLSNNTFRAHRYGPDYPGLQGKAFEPQKLDLWNRLYNPETYTPVERHWIGTEKAPIVAEKEPTKKDGPKAREGPKPSAVKSRGKAPSAAKPEEKMRSRLDALGY